MPKSKGIKTETIKREVNLVNTIQSVSLQTNGSATSSGSGGGAIDWKKKYKEEFDKRFAIEEQYDDLQTQVFIVRKSMVLRPLVQPGTGTTSSRTSLDLGRTVK